MADNGEIKPGDWVRFYQDGTLRIGIVAYIRARLSWQSYETAETDIGSVYVDSIKEVRRG